jgi:hypothetical protein
MLERRRSMALLIENWWTRDAHGTGEWISSNTNSARNNDRCFCEGFAFPARLFLRRGFAPADRGFGSGTDRALYRDVQQGRPPRS